jgi:hypothetical protein
MSNHTRQPDSLVDPNAWLQMITLEEMLQYRAQNAVSASLALPVSTADGPQPQSARAQAALGLNHAHETALALCERSFCDAAAGVTTPAHASRTESADQTSSAELGAARLSADQSSMVLPRPGVLSQAGDGHAQPGEATADLDILPSSSPSPGRRRFSLWEQLILFEAKAQGLTSSLFHDDVMAKLVASFNRVSGSAVLCTVNHIRGWIREHQRANALSAPASHFDLDGTELMPKLKDLGIAVNPLEPGTRVKSPNFTPTQVAELNAHAARGVDGSSKWQAVYRKLALSLNPSRSEVGAAPILGHHVRAWFQNFGRGRRALQGQAIRDASFHFSFADQQLKLLHCALDAGVSRSGPARVTSSHPLARTRSPRA